MASGSRIFAVGDIHGHAHELAALMRRLYDDAKYNPSRDYLVFLGDLVDGGHYSRQVVEFVEKMEDTYPETFTCLMGNHEEMMINALTPNAMLPEIQMWWWQGGRETAQSFLPDGEEASMFNLAAVRTAIGAERMHRFTQRRLYKEITSYLFVHAGVRPGAGYATSREDLLWIRDEFIDYEDELLIPRKTIVFGHTYHKEPLVQWNKIGIDTMHHDGGYLTAVQLYPHETSGTAQFWFSDR